MSAPAQPDRRAAFRRAIPFGVDITKVNAVEFRRKWANEIGVNISGGGFCCYSFQPFPEGATIRCHILFPPPHDERMIEGEAQVMWQKPHQNEHRQAWFHGLKFVKIDQHDRQFLDAVLAAY